MSPRTPKQFKDIREEKRNLIMDVALEHFAKAGFHATTINHIARHAGISKGLMYNYFSSKEELLSELIKRSVNEIYSNFDIDRDGYLSEEEFEVFIRKVYLLLREKRSIWRLLFQLMMQREVMDHFTGAYKIQESAPSTSDQEQEWMMAGVAKMVRDYFARKAASMPAGYDPVTEMEMFIHTFKGFSMAVVFSDDKQTVLYNKTVDRIIETYK
jgi:AcrR family transcriptional regulator